MSVDHRVIVANAFRIFGVLLGLPAAVVLIKLVVDFATLHSAPPVQPAHHLDVGTYGIVALLSYGAQGMGALLGFLGTLAVFAAVLIGIAAALALGFAILLYFTSRGIGRGQSWARVTAILISIFFLLSWIGALFAVQRDFIAVACGGVALSLYALWVLGWKYAPPVARTGT
ncbi:MAG TPA: hypothetical protein VIJ85_03695 [Rhizomicrobium sp.]